MTQLMTFLTVASIVLILMVLRSVRTSRVRVEYSVSWLAAGLLLLLLSRMPGTLRAIAHWMGIEDLSVALLLLAMIVFLGVFYRFSAVVSDLKDMNVALAQRVAILEYQLHLTDEKANSAAAR